MDSRSRGAPEARAVDDGPAPVRWDRGQDHLERFTNLIGQELEDELSTVESVGGTGARRVWLMLV